MVHIHEIRVGPSWMDPIVKFLKDDVLPEEKSEPEKIRRKAPRFWLSKDHKLYRRSYSSHICCVFTQKHQSYCLKSCTKGFVGVTQEKDLCRTELLPRDIGGRECRRKPWNMLRSVTSAKGSPQIFIIQEGSSTLYLVHGRSPSGAWIL